MDSEIEGFRWLNCFLVKLLVLAALQMLGQ
jgi:hypothetical protein